jgi:hypothetical protein
MQAGTDAAKKQQAALLRALTHTDLDDELVWLERCEPTSPETRASQAEARGEKAKRDGKDAEAANHFREAAKIYAGLLGAARSTARRPGAAAKRATMRSIGGPALWPVSRPCRCFRP